MSGFHFSLATSDSKAIAREYCASFYNGEPVLSVSSNTFGEVPVFFDKVNNGQRFDCVELDPKIFNKGIKPFNKLKAKYPSLTYHNKNVFDMDFSQYGRINLDFCGQLTNTLMFNLFKHLQNYNGKVFITLLRAREHFHVEYYGAKSKEHFRDEVFPQMIKKFTGLDVYLPRHDYKNYKEGSNRPSLMMVYSFFRKDNDTINEIYEEKKLISDYLERTAHIHMSDLNMNDIHTVAEATGLKYETVEYYFKKYIL